MARYFFHLRDGQDLLIDPEGREIPDRAHIAKIVLKEARSMMSQDMLQGRLRLDQSIDVIDEAGVLVHHLSFRDAVKITE